VSEAVTITLAEPWTYRTPLVTISYPAGVHAVPDDIAAAAPQHETPEETDGPIATPRAPRRSRKTKG
jgi:hypothetical protein